MPNRIAQQQLSRLERLKTDFSPANRKTIEQLLKRLARQTFSDADSLIRLHEALVFLRAYPQSTTSLNQTERMLRQFARRIREAEEREEDLTALDHPEMSGIAGRTVVDTFSYPIVANLVDRYPRQVSFYWDWFEDENRLRQAWPRFMPLLEEDAAVEANIPFREWLLAARGKKDELPWLIEAFARLPLDEAKIAELYDSQKLYVSWKPSYRSTRTGLRLPPRLRGGRSFYHRQQLIQRREVSLVEELGRSVKLHRLTKSEGETVLNLARDASTTRYRELYGFTHGDSTRVIRAHLGRAVDVFVFGLPSDKRLPLRAYHAAMIFKNQVPVGYFEGLSLSERMESGFNLYYTFREGETAWLYAKTLAVMRQLLGVTTFVLDPYQVGFENEEGIESGAFWFYRKFGFRPVDKKLLMLAEEEEAKIREQKSYRTSPNTLRKLARSSMVFELNAQGRGDWDQFQVRKIGLAVQKEMAESFGGNASEMRLEASRVAQRILKISARRLSRIDNTTFENFALVLLLVHNFKAWSVSEKQLVVSIIEAKSGADEGKYLRLTQRHEKFRNALIDLGS